MRERGETRKGTKHKNEVGVRKKKKTIRSGGNKKPQERLFIQLASCFLLHQHVLHQHPVIHRPLICPIIQPHNRLILLHPPICLHVSSLCSGPLYVGVSTGNRWSGGGRGGGCRRRSSNGGPLIAPLTRRACLPPGASALC